MRLACFDGRPAASGWRLLLAGCLLAVAAAAVLPLDLPAARFCLEDRVPGVLAKLLDLSEAFGHGLGVAVVLWAAFRLGRLPPQAAGEAAVLSYGAGLTANLGKLVVGRVRPKHFFRALGGGNLPATFVGWCPLLSGGRWSEALQSSVQSFPSAHTATAVGLAVALSRLFPHGRRFFFVLAVLVALQRIESGAHYVSDTLAGASAACFWCALWSSLRPRLRRRFGR